MREYRREKGFERVRAWSELEWSFRLMVLRRYNDCSRWYIDDFLFLFFSAVE